MRTQFISGQLQLDKDRGVMYFHANIEEQEKGCVPTPLRICGVGFLQDPNDGVQIDITIRESASGEVIAKVSK